MTHDDDAAVLAATQRFYAALEQMITGRGLDAMKAAWHHSPNVTSGHPTGDWAHGWDEVLATWEVFASFGKPENAGTRITDIRVHRYGDVAYTTSVFIAAPAFGSARMSCTNVLVRVDGDWKVVHHHADKAPVIEQTLEKMARGE